MSISGYAVRMDGALLIDTVMASERGAMVSFLIVYAEQEIEPTATDKDVAAMFEEVVEVLKGDDSEVIIVSVTISEEVKAEANE